jgi:hypothetical protein
MVISLLLIEILFYFSRSLLLNSLILEKYVELLFPEESSMFS